MYMCIIVIDTFRDVRLGVRRQAVETPAVYEPAQCRRRRIALAPTQYRVIFRSELVTNSGRVSSRKRTVDVPERAKVTKRRLMPEAPLRQSDEHTSVEVLLGGRRYRTPGAGEACLHSKQPSPNYLHTRLPVNVYLCIPVYACTSIPVCLYVARFQTALPAIECPVSTSMHPDGP